MPGMARVCFTPNLQRHVNCPDVEAAGGTVRAVLDDVFAENPRARGYVLDDQGALRHHMAIFINGNPVRDRVRLSDSVPDDAEVYVFQALSGG
jgi:sulfur-carrier protein